MNKIFTKITAVIMGIVLSAGCILPLTALVYAEDPLVIITEQPQDAYVSYPDGAEFHVEVNNPGNVESYQWYASDGYIVYELSGTSALTDTLIVPSTQQLDPDMHYECAITDKSGNTIYSDGAVLSIMNMEEDKPVLYINDYAIEPGESLDMADIQAGTGSISYDIDGSTITLDHVNMSNETVTYDLLLCPAMGLYLTYRKSSTKEYHVVVKGDCVINNIFYDYRYNSGGVDFNAFFALSDEESNPTVVFEGDGTLTLKGGSNQIYSDSNLRFAVDIHTETNGNLFCDGIRGDNIVVDEGVTLDLNVQGTALHAENNIVTGKGSKILASSSAPHVSVGPTTKNIVFLKGSWYANETEIRLTGRGEKDMFIPYGSILATYNGIAMIDDGDLVLNSSTLDIDLSAEDGGQLYSLNFNGITSEGDENNLILENGSEISINIDSPTTANCGGIYLSDSLEVKKDGRIRINVNGAGEVSGIMADGKVRITDGIVDVSVSSSDGGLVLGIVSAGTEIDLNDPKYTVHSLAENGLALAADTGEHVEETVDYVPGYRAEKIVLGKRTGITDPKKNEINLTGVPGYGEMIKAETVYDSDDTAKPAAEVTVIGHRDYTVAWITAGAVAAAIAAVLVLRKRKNK